MANEIAAFPVGRAATFFKWRYHKVHISNSIRPSMPISAPLKKCKKVHLSPCNATANVLYYSALRQQGTTLTTKTRTKKMNYENNGEVINLGRITTITTLVMAAIAVLAVLNV